MAANVPDEAFTVFLSWSGAQSKAVAASLREWIPNLFDQVVPWMSDKDIASGARGLDEIRRTLQLAKFGILVVTPENQASSWLTFEAGALSRALNSSALVVPLLVGFSSPSDLAGPLSQFQARMLDESDTKKLVTTLGDKVGLASATVERRFDAFWPRLAEEVAGSFRVASVPDTKRSERDLLLEIVGRVRSLHRADFSIPQSLISRIDAMVEDLERGPTPLDFADSGYVGRFVDMASDLRQIGIALEPFTDEQ